MDYNLADYAMQMDPMQRQAMEAQLLRRRQQSDQLRQASAQANQYNQLAQVAKMANNPGAAAATEMAQEQAQKQYLPKSMGQQGFMLPNSGDFVSSPMYEDEKDAQRTSRRDLQREQVDAKVDMQRFRAEAAEAAQAERLAASAQRAAEANQFRMTLATMMESGRNDRHAAGLQLRETLAAERAAGKGGNGKVLAASEVRKLTDKESAATSMGELISGFKDEFAGTVGVASLQNTLGKYQPMGLGSQYAEQSNWWQAYNESKNQARHQLFGSALTASEKAAYDAANVSEGMEPKQIRIKLAQQQAAMIRAYNKLKNAQGKAGYNMSGFEDLPETAMPLPGSPPAKAGTPASAKKLPTIPGLPPGFKIVGEAP